MTESRYLELYTDLSDTLTQEEVNQGWYFNEDMDGLIENKYIERKRRKTLKKRGEKDLLIF